MVWYLIFSVLLCITGLFMLISPNAYYRETQAWKQNKPTEPSRAYIIFTRISGGMMLLAGIGCMILLIVAQFLT